MPGPAGGAEAPHRAISVAGVVDVKDELRLDFQITAREAR
jgi:hypothetical protein